jgi:hypothetical protein
MRRMVQTCSRPQTLAKAIYWDVLRLPKSPLRAVVSGRMQRLNPRNRMKNEIIYPFHGMRSPHWCDYFNGHLYMFYLIRPSKLKEPLTDFPFH